jgi:hypothetical protein
MLAWPRSRDRDKCLRVALFESHEPEIFIGAVTLQRPTHRPGNRQLRLVEGEHD